MVRLTNAIYLSRDGYIYFGVGIADPRIAIVMAVGKSAARHGNKAVCCIVRDRWSPRQINRAVEGAFGIRGPSSAPVGCPGNAGVDEYKIICGKVFVSV